jgi:hypothetical protein
MVDICNAAKTGLAFVWGLAVFVGMRQDCVRGGEALSSGQAGDVAEIRSSVLARHNLVESLDVRYCIIAASGNPFDPYVYVRHHLILKNRHRYRENVHFTDRQPPSVDVNHTMQFFDGETLDVFFVASRMYETSRNNASSIYMWKVRLDPILDCMGWWPENDDSPVNPDVREAAMPLRFALELSDYVLNPELEVVDGHRCCVLESPALDRLWLDPQIGYAIRKRETFDPASGVMLRRQLSSEFRRYEADVAGRQAFWIPLRTRLELRNAGADLSESRGYDIVIEEVRVNEVDNCAFDFTPPPGTLIQDRDSGKVYQVPGGIDLLDNTVALARYVLQSFGGPVPQVSSKTSGDTVVLIAPAVALIGANVYLVLRFCVRWLRVA